MTTSTFQRALPRWRKLLINRSTVAPLSSYAAVSHSYSSSQSGGTIGGQFGCQYQWGWFVLGGEWDANWAGVKDDNTFAYTAAATNNVWFPRQEWTHTQMDWFTTARVRVGAAWWDRVLVYATGGLAMASVDSYTHVAFNNGNNPFFIPQYFGAYRESRIGWTVGGGIEWAFAQNWTAKAEFLYIDLGSDDYISPRTSYNGTTDTRVWASSVDTQAYVARVGINYLFHLGPVVADDESGDGDDGRIGEAADVDRPRGGAAELEEFLGGFSTLHELRMLFDPDVSAVVCEHQAGQCRGHPTAELRLAKCKPRKTDQ